MFVMPPTSEYIMLRSSEIGIRLKRKTTDILFLVCLCMLWLLLIVLCRHAIQNANVQRLFRGMDYEGNLCGIGSAPSGIKDEDWQAMTNLWMPFNYDATLGTVVVAKAMNMGVCVRECPAIQSKVIVYGKYPLVSVWNVEFLSTSYFHRCYPHFSTFHCDGNQHCIASLLTAQKRFREHSPVGFVAGVLAQLYATWWVPCLSCGVTVVLCFMWLLLIRALVRPVMLMTMVLSVVALGATGFEFYWHRKLLRDSSTPDQPTSEGLFLAAAIVCWVLAFLLGCLVVHLRKKIGIACELIKEASKVPAAIPTTLIVPPIVLLMLIPIVVLCGVLAIYSHAMGGVAHSKPSYIPNPASYSVTLNKNATVASLEPVTWAPSAQYFNLFMFLWSMAGLHALTYMIVAMTTVFWYFSTPGEPKTLPPSPVATAFFNSIRYHLGTIALGAFLVAVVRFLRWIVGLVEKQLRKERESVLACIACCLRCWLSCFDRTLRFVSNHAYAVTAITGENFFPAAKHGMSLILSNLTVTSVTRVGDWMMVFGKVLITAVTTIIAWMVTTRCVTTDHVSLILALSAFASYIVASVFAAVFAICLDAILICYCYDRESEADNGGVYYYSPALHGKLALGNEDDGKY